MTSTHHPLWTEGVCDDGAAILCDGTLVSISDVLLALNHREALRVAWTRLPRRVEYRMPTYDQCEAKVASGNATELERFIYNNEPAGTADREWRRSLAAVLAEVVEEDRWASLPSVGRV